MPRSQFRRCITQYEYLCMGSWIIQSFALIMSCNDDFVFMKDHCTNWNVSC